MCGGERSLPWETAPTNHRWELPKPTPSLHENRGVLPAKRNCDNKEHQMLFLICHLRKRGGKGGSLCMKANTTMAKNHSKVCKPHIPITHGNSRETYREATYSRPKISNSTKKWTWLKNKCTLVFRVMWCSLQMISKSLCLKHDFLTLEVPAKDADDARGSSKFKDGEGRTQLGFTIVLWTLQFWQRKIYTELKYH